MYLFLQNNVVPIKKESKKEPFNTISVKEEKGFLPILTSLLIGVFSEGLGVLLRVPVGAMGFSMMAVAFYDVKTEQTYMPLPLRKIIQAVGGALIGSRVNMGMI